MTEQQRQIARYISRHRAFSPYTQQAGPAPLAWLKAMERQLPTLEQFRRELLEDAEFRALGLGSWLGTTDGEIIAQAVSAVIPPVYGPAYQLAVKGLILAAKDQSNEGKKTAGAIAIGAIVVGSAVALGAGGDA
jgi:hypothetical protein